MIPLEARRYPRAAIGEVAKTFHLATDEWIDTPRAVKLSGIAHGSLAKWEQQEVISCRQEMFASPRRYLAAEMRLLASWKVAQRPPNLWMVRWKLEERKGPQHDPPGERASASG